MLCLDNNLLSDYLDGRDEAQRFLQQYEDEPWGVSSIVLYEAVLGAIHGYVGGDVPTVHEAITSSMTVFDVTEHTAIKAADLQRDLLSRGVPVDHPDALIAANAREYGGTFATAEKQFWSDDVRDVLDVAVYDPY